VLVSDDFLQEYRAGESRRWSEAFINEPLGCRLLQAAGEIFMFVPLCSTATGKQLKPVPPFGLYLLMIEGYEKLACSMCTTKYWKQTDSHPPPALVHYCFFVVEKFECRLFAFSLETESSIDSVKNI
jgi:hypothetical protein